MQGRTLSKDILMICKGWYGENEPNKIAALKSYIFKYTGCKPDNETVLHFLRHAVRKFIGTNSLLEQLNPYCGYTRVKDINVEQFLIDSFISALSLREVTDIDLSAYKLLHIDADDTRNWWELLEMGDTEDDRY